MRTAPRVYGRLAARSSGRAIRQEARMSMYPVRLEGELGHDRVRRPASEPGSRPLVTSAGPQTAPRPDSTGAPGRTMKAVVRDRYGSADVLRVADVGLPQVGDEDVLVRVRAAGLDRGAWHIMAGLPYLIRSAGYGVRRPKTAGLGSELAGVVEAVGANVPQFQPGDAVFGTCSASFAEYASARPEKLARMPANLTFEQAAAVPVSALTALQALRDRGRVRS